MQARSNQTPSDSFEILQLPMSVKVPFLFLDTPLAAASIAADLRE